jgi:release factor H-coupled RctB family protein
MIRQLSERVSIITAEKLWLEDAALQQLLTTAELPGMYKTVGLPDLHPGRGYPVGAAFFTIDRFYPALVGNDIGCGMGLWQTDLSAHKVKLDKIDKQLGDLDKGIDDDEWEALHNLDDTLLPSLETLKDNISTVGLSTTHLKSLGTVGSGNHFMELQVIDQVSSELPPGINQKELQLLVHTGSRGLGQAILRAHVDHFSHGGLEADTPEAEEYLRQHAAAVQFATLNRTVVALRVANRLRCKISNVLGVNHNIVSKATIDGKTGFLHRKGASPSDEGLVMLPGSRGDHSYLLEPVPSELSLNSVAHGAGRKWARTDCKRKLFDFTTLSELKRTALGSRVICEDRALIYEEAPQAYKNVNSVLESLVQSGLVKVLARSKPVLTYKTRGECCT